MRRQGPRWFAIAVATVALVAVVACHAPLQPLPIQREAIIADSCQWQLLDVQIWELEGGESRLEFGSSVVAYSGRALSIPDTYLVEVWYCE